MQATFQTIRDEIARDAVLKERLGTRLYRNVAPERATKPYVVYTDTGSSAPQFTTGQSFIQEQGVQLSVFSTSAHEAEELAERLFKRLAKRKLFVEQADTFCLDVRPSGPTLIKAPEDDLWQGLIELEVLMQSATL